MRLGCISPAAPVLGQGLTHLLLCCTCSEEGHSRHGSNTDRGKALHFRAAASATAPDDHDTCPLSAFSVMWYVSPVKRGCCPCSPPVVAASSLPSSCHPQSPLCTARAPTSWRSLLQPRYLSGERQAQDGVGSKQDGRGLCRSPLTAG